MSKKVLIIDDSPDLLRLWKMVFASSTHEMEFVESAATARACVENGFKPDVVVCDYNLEDALGTEVKSQLEDLGVNGEFIYLTGEDNPSLLKILKTDAKVLQKPVPIQNLKDLLA